MHRLKKWFGISDHYPDDKRVESQTYLQANTHGKLTLSSSEHQRGDSNVQTSEQYRQFNQPTTLNSPYLAEIQADRIETWIRQHVRIKADDCLGCKIVCTCTITFFCGTAMSQVPKLRSKLPTRFGRWTTFGNVALGLVYLAWLRSLWFYDKTQLAQNVPVTQDREASRT